MNESVGRMRHFWGCFGAISGLFLGIRGLFWPIFGNLGLFQGYFGPIFRDPGLILAYFWGIWCCAILGLFWQIFLGIWDCFMAISDQFSNICGLFWPILGDLGLFQGYFGPIFEDLGLIYKIWACFGSVSLILSGPILAYLHDLESKSVSWPIGSYCRETAKEIQILRQVFQTETKILIILSYDTLEPESVSFGHLASFIWVLYLRIPPWHQWTQ